jgi:hypothetical protein
MLTDVSEEHIATIFRVEEKDEQETSVKPGVKSYINTVLLLHTLSANFVLTSEVRVGALE